MSKIALLTPTYIHYSGIDRVVEQQAKEYSSKGHKVTVFAFEGDIKPKGYEVIFIGMPKSPFLQRLYRLFFFLDVFKINRTANMLRDFEIAVSHFYPMNLIASKAKKKYHVEYVYHNHGIGYNSLFSGIERVYMMLFSWFSRLSLRSVDYAVSISKFMQKELKKETGLESAVVYNTIDREKFKKGLNKSIIRKKLGIKNEKMLLFIGRISPHKNIHELIDIFKIISKKIDSVLVIAGKPTFPRYYDILRKKAGKNNIIFVNDVKESDLPLFYAACDLYVTASLWEGFNLPLAEAQSCGKKVIAYNVCSHPEIIKNGVLVKNGDINAFADAAVRLLKK